MNAGAATVEWLRQAQFQVDEAWAETTPDGFRWWPEHHAQTVEVVGSEAAPDGSTSYFVSVRTDFVRNVELDEEVLTAVNARLGPTASMAGAVYFPNVRSLQLCSSVRVHDDNLLWASRLVNMAATLQLSEAAEMAAEISNLVDGEPARSAHPASGTRPQPDEAREMAGLLIAPMGREACRWMPAEFARAIVGDSAGAYARVATRSACGLNLSIPFGQGASQLELVGDRPHPRYGNGLACRQSFPFEGPASLGANMALVLNAIELTERAYGYGFGSYVYRNDAIEFVSFYPNLMHRPGMLPLLLRAGIARARELSLSLTGRPWSPSEHVQKRSRIVRLFARLRQRR